MNDRKNSQDGRMGEEVGRGKRSPSQRRSRNDALGEMLG